MEEKPKPESKVIVVTKFRGKARERFPEWITSIGILWWGLVALAFPALFDQKYFYPLTLFMAQPYWAIVTILVGIGSVFSLLVNGVWRPTAHLRAIFSIAKIAIWSTLLLASLSTTGHQLGVPTFSMLIVLDMAALWWAAGDARLADDLARKTVKNGH